MWPSFVWLGPGVESSFMIYCMEQAEFRKPVMWDLAVYQNIFLCHSILCPSGKISVSLWWVPSPLCWMKTLFRGCSWRASLVIEDDDRNRLGFNLWNSKGAREMNTHTCTRYTYSAVFKIFQYCVSRWHFGGNTEY